MATLYDETLRIREHLDTSGYEVYLGTRWIGDILKRTDPHTGKRLMGLSVYTAILREGTNGMYPEYKVEWQGVYTNLNKAVLELLSHYLLNSPRIVALPKGTELVSEEI